MVANGKDLSMIAGDSACLQIVLKKEGLVLPFGEGDIVFLSIKKSLKDSDYILQKKSTDFNEDGIARIVLAAEDTRDLPPYKYLYDIQVNFANGDVKTIVGPNRFTLNAGVTHD